VQHTSEEHAGQIYMPQVNWIMLAGVLVLVVMFRSSENLASAYGISVTGTMIVTALMASYMMVLRWQWSPVAVALLMIPLLLIDLVFLGANLLKVLDGGWVTLLVGACMFTVMFVWWRGTQVLLARTTRNELLLEDVATQIERSKAVTVKGTAVYLTAHPQHVPTALLHTLKHFKAIHEQIIVLTVLTSEWPHLSPEESVSIERVSPQFVRVRVVVGFMQQPNIAEVLQHCRLQGLPVDLASTSFFLSRRSLKRNEPSALPRPVTALYIALAENAADATDYFRIPKDRVVEIGTQVGL
jgi:KUP system potassium uptake protein